jgi:GDPmannose 4,6-dehydratase
LLKKILKSFHPFFRWKGALEEEIGYNSENGDILVRVDSKYYRPTEVDLLLGDATKAKTLIGWEPKISFDQLVEEMVLSDLEAVKQPRHDYN